MTEKKGEKNLIVRMPEKWKKKEGIHPPPKKGGKKNKKYS